MVRSRGNQFESRPDSAIVCSHWRRNYPDNNIPASSPTGIQMETRAGRWHSGGPFPSTSSTIQRGDRLSGSALACLVGSVISLRWENTRGARILTSPTPRVSTLYGCRDGFRYDRPRSTRVFEGTDVPGRPIQTTRRIRLTIRRHQMGRQRGREPSVFAMCARDCAVGHLPCLLPILGRRRHQIIERRRGRQDAPSVPAIFASIAPAARALSME